MADSSPVEKSAPPQPSSKPVHETASSADDRTIGHSSPGGGNNAYDFLEKPQGKGELGRLDHFRILKELGRGGMGCVLLAEDTNLERQVALKVMLPEYAKYDTAKSRFLREAKAAGQIHHDHVVTIHHVGEASGVPYIAMEFLKGMPLDKYLKDKGDLALPMVLRIGREIALGLAEAHKKGLIHRDIKPANVWLEAPKGRVKILDFGLARKEEAEEQHLTQSGAVVGTPAYMSPEQAMGQEVDARADLFSLGVLLYRLATGRPAFIGPTTTSVLLQVMNHEPTSASKVKPGVPEEMSRIIDKLMSKAKESRYKSAAAFLADWEPLMKSLSKGEPPTMALLSAQISGSTNATTAERIPTGTATAKENSSKRGPKLLIGLAFGFLAISILAWQIIIRITDEKGNVKNIDVPKGGKVEIVEKPDPKKPSVVNPPVYVPVALGEKDAKQLQQDWATKLKMSVDEKSKLGIVMVLIPPGGEALSKPYLLGKYEVTQGEWESVMGYNPSTKKELKMVAGLDVSRFPVASVSWYDSVEFCNTLSEQEGLKPYYEMAVTMRGKDDKHIKEAEVKILGGNGYHIPTDAEWEHGCRAGTTTKYHFGDKDEGLLEYAWFQDNGEKRSHSVGEKKPNAFGLHDMHGNVREWNEDMLTNGVTGAPERVSRGGAWYGTVAHCAVSHRFQNDPAYRFFSFGLRLARTPVIADQTIEAKTHPEEGQYYRIRNVNSKKALALDDGAKPDDAKVIQVIPGPKDLQQWKFVKVGDFYKIINRKSGKAMEVQSGSKEEGAVIQQYEDDGGENQHWSLERKGGNFVIKAKHSGMVIDVAEGSKMRRAPVIQSPFNEGHNQFFELVPIKK